MHQQQSLPQLQAQQFIAPPHPTLQLSFSNSQTYTCSSLYIATYGGSSLFLHSCLGKQKYRNRLNFSKAKQQALADLYQVNDHIFLVFNDNLQPMKEIYLAKFIHQKIDFQRAILFTSISRTTLREANQYPLNAISTSLFQENGVFPRFSEGLMGICADLLQWGQINKTPVVCFVGLFGQYQLSSQIIEKTFGALRGKYGLNSTFDISQKVKRYNMKKYSHKIYL